MEWCGAQALPGLERNTDANSFYKFHLVDLENLVKCVQSEKRGLRFCCYYFDHKLNQFILALNITTDEGSCFKSLF